MKRKIISMIAVVLTVTAGITIWKVRTARARSAMIEASITKKLSADDLREIVKSQSWSDPEKTRALAEDAQAKKSFVTGLREYLALAASARREGLGDDPNFSLNFENKRKALLASLYETKREADKKEPIKITPEQVAEVWNDPANEAQFKAEFDALAAIQRSAAENMESQLGVSPPLAGEGLEKTRKGWARTKLVSDMARADDEFMALPVVALREKILEAGILSTNYLAKHWRSNIRASEEDIAAYLADHPEYDLGAKHQKAEKILQRALSGENFEKLAKEFSEDRGTRDGGGLYKDYAIGALWKEVEAKALGLKPGQIADSLVESKDGYHVIQLVARTGSGADTKLTIRSILFQKSFEDPSIDRFVPDVPAPFKTPREIAKNQVEKAKRRAFLDSIVARESIELADDFELDPQNTTNNSPPAAPVAGH